MLWCTGCYEVGNMISHLLGGDSHKYYSFVHGYYGMDIYEIETSNHIGLVLNLRNENIVAEAFPLCCNDSDYNETLADKHRTLSEKYGDTNNGDFWSSKDLDFGNYALADSFVDIDIVSDAEYDDEHPAGTSLADIVRVSFRTFYPFVSGETKRASSEKVYKRVSELTPTDMILVEATPVVFTFTFRTPPLSAQQHNFTIIFTSDEGNVYRYSCSVDFEQPNS